MNVICICLDNKIFYYNIFDMVLRRATQIQTEPAEHKQFVWKIAMHGTHRSHSNRQIYNVYIEVIHELNLYLD